MLQQANCTAEAAGLLLLLQQGCQELPPACDCGPADVATYRSVISITFRGDRGKYCAIW